MDSLPPAPPAIAAPASPGPEASSPAAPGDIFPRDARERELCARADHPDWFYLGGLALLDTASVWAGASVPIKYSTSLLVRSTGPLMIGFAWGATLSGSWLALPKCSFEWVGEAPREGRGRPSWPLALSVALLAGLTAPVVSFIAIGYCSETDGGPSNLCQNGFVTAQTTLEREMRLVVAGVAGFGGALLPYLIPPETVRAARELDRIRFGLDGHGGGFVGYTTTF